VFYAISRGGKSGATIREIIDYSKKESPETRKEGTLRARVTWLLDHGWIREASFKRTHEVLRWRKGVKVWVDCEYTVYIACEALQKTFGKFKYSEYWRAVESLEDHRDELDEQIREVREQQRKVFRQLHRALRRAYP